MLPPSRAPLHLSHQDSPPRHFPALCIYRPRSGLGSHIHLPDRFAPTGPGRKVAPSKGSNEGKEKWQKSCSGKKTMNFIFTFCDKIHHSVQQMYLGEKSNPCQQCTFWQKSYFPLPFERQRQFTLISRLFVFLTQQKKPIQTKGRN